MYKGGYQIIDLGVLPVEESINITDTENGKIIKSMKEQKTSKPILLVGEFEGTKFSKHAGSYKNISISNVQYDFVVVPYGTTVIGITIVLKDDIVTVLLS